MPRTSLRNGLDRDVYQIVKKLEAERESNGDGKQKRRQKLTVTDIYESIKRSNSSLSRQKRKPLEDAIERVLDLRKEEEQEAEDSDDLLEAAEEAEKAFKREERSLLNRQMTKHWNIKPAAVAGVTAEGDEGKSTKKRRLSIEPEAGNGTISDASAIAPSNTTTNAVASDVPAKKALKPSKYGPEQIPPGSVVLAGVDVVLEELNRCVFARIEKPENFIPFGKQPVGVIISGPPGTGKQSLVRYLSWETGTPIISLGRYLTETRSPDKVSKVMTDVLDEAKKLAPCVVLIEKLDKYMAKPGNNHSDFAQEVTTQLQLNLQRLREWEGDRRVVIVGTTSKPELVDPSLKRPDYFARTITVKMPDTVAREEIFRVHTRNLSIPSNVDFKALADRTHGFVGEDIRGVVDEANYKAANCYMEMEYSVAKNAAQSERMETDGDSDGSRAKDLGDERRQWYDLVRDSSYTNKTRTQVSHQNFLDAIAEYTPYLRREGFSPIPSTTWSEVGALHSVRAAFQISVVRRIKEPLLFQKFGKQRPTGVLLFGPPGCGKTLVAQAVANDAQASFILIKGPELLNKYVGESERAIRELFTRAKACAPCIIFFDEMDSLVPKRENTTTEAGARVVNALLAELDGAGERGEVYVIGTSNRPDMIDPAVLRPGRLDTLLFVDLPTEDERVDILRTIVRNDIGGTEGAEIEAIARDPRCKGFSGADLYGLYKTAMNACILRYEGGEPAFIREDWEAALLQTKPSVSVSDAEAYREIASTLHYQH